MRAMPVPPRKPHTEVNVSPVISVLRDPMPPLTARLACSVRPQDWLNPLETALQVSEICNQIGRFLVSSKVYMCWWVMYSNRTWLLTKKKLKNHQKLSNLKIVLTIHICWIRLTGIRRPHLLCYFYIVHQFDYSNTIYRVDCEFY